MCWLDDRAVVVSATAQQRFAPKIWLADRWPNCWQMIGRLLADDMPPDSAMGHHRAVVGTDRWLTIVGTPSVKCRVIIGRLYTDRQPIIGPIINRSLAHPRLQQ
jgi:hypothetical protein